MYAEKGHNPMEKFTVLGPFTTDPLSPGFPGFGSVSVPNSHLPSQHLRHTNCSCSLQEKAGSSKTQTAVIITLSTSFLELVLRSRWELIRFKLPLTLPFLLGFSHSSHSYVPHEEHFNPKPRRGAPKWYRGRQEQRSGSAM